MCAASSSFAVSRRLPAAQRFDGKLEEQGEAALVDGVFERTRHPVVAAATPGDHSAVFPFLTHVFQAPSHDAFLSSLDDPFYEPRDRLLVKSGNRVLSHLQLCKRVMCIGSLRLPVAVLRWVGTLPEFRGQGFASRLMQLADQCMTEDGTAIGWLTTRIPHFFRPSGWAVCGRHCVSSGNTRDLLAQLMTEPRPVWQETANAISVRPWRQVELPSVMRLYRQRFSTAHGALERTEPFWRWLVSRKAFEQIYVAIEGPDRFELDDGTAPIVGYIVTSQDRILELATDPGRADVARHLLSRACGEAIERDYSRVSLAAPPDEALHALFRSAGGTTVHHEAHQGEVQMARVLDPVGLLRTLCPELQRRVERHRLQRPCELGILCENLKLRLIISRRSVKLATDKVGRGYLSCNSAELTRLLLGHTDVEEAVASGRIEASNRVALRVAQVVFERQPLWRPAFDDLEPG